jgi:hypothetical protein
VQTDRYAQDNQPKLGLRYCANCNDLIIGNSQVIEEKHTCLKCAAEVLKLGPEERRKAFVGGLLFGLAAAVLAIAFCTLFGVATGLDVNYTALFVGWLIAAGMMQGSSGARGPQYQFASAILTYFTVSLSSIPIYLIPVVFWLPQDFSWNGIMGKLAYWAVASPMLELKRGISGCAGLAVLFLGMRLATKMTAVRRQDSPLIPEEKKELQGV